MVHLEVESNLFNELTNQPINELSNRPDKPKVNRNGGINKMIGWLLESGLVSALRIVKKKERGYARQENNVPRNAVKNLKISIKIVR
jgi:hypothetical protein